VQKEIVGISVELGTQHAGRDCNGSRQIRTQPVSGKARLASQSSQEFLLVHAVFEGFAAVDENDRNFIVELAAKIGVRINIDLLPGESSTSRKLKQTLFYDFTQMAAFAGIDNDAARLWHAGEILARGNHAFQ